MKFRVERNDLTDAVAWTARTLPARATVPVLSGLLLEVSEAAEIGGLRLSGFDFEVAAQARVEVGIGEPGRVLVSGRLLAEICRSLPQAPVEISGEGSRLILSCGSARFTLPTMPVEDYPQLPTLPPVAGEMSSASFAEAVAQVAIAAGRDDTLPVLTGIRIEIEGDRLTFAATDRYRLAVRETSWTPAVEGLSTVALVPFRTLVDTAKTLAGSNSPVTLSLGTGAQGEAMAGFTAGDRSTTTRLLDGEFPKYRALLPASFEATADVDTATLTEALKRVALVSTTRTAPVRLSFTSDEVVLEAGSGEDATAKESLPSRLVGEPLTIAFNPAFLLDGLAQMGTPTARLSFTSPTRPAVVTGVPAQSEAAPSAPVAGDAGDADAPVTDLPIDDAGYRYLLMPVRLPS